MSQNQDINAAFIQFLSENPQVKIVCFDYFDTLVKRTVMPEATKQIACEQLSLLMNRRFSGFKLYKWRSELEMQICTENAINGGDNEFNLIDFAIQFKKHLQKQLTKEKYYFSTKDFVEKIINIEIAVEKAVQEPCEDTITMLKGANSQGLKTAIVSDFYLPGRYFKQFIEFHHIEKYVDAVFVSADTGLTKASGRNYESVLKAFTCRPENILMVGDNFHTDHNMAKKKGIRSFFIDRKEQKAVYTRWAKKELPEKVEKLKRQLSGEVEKNRNQVYPELALTLWYFSYLLWQRLCWDGIRDVFFMSKEGEFLRFLFDRFQNDFFGSEIIQSHYLIISRKASYIGSLKSLKEENFTGIFNQYRNISPRDFLLSLSFKEKEALDICDHLNVNLKEIVTNFPESAEYRNILSFKKFQVLYENKRNEQRNNLITYLDSFGIDYHREGINLVDVGWKGSIQDNLFFTLKERVDVNGYYVGLLQPTNVSKKNCKQGILFSETPQKSPYFDVYRNNTSLFEMILGASHGSADGYYSIKERDPLENRLHTRINHLASFDEKEICITTVDYPEERLLFKKHIKPLQKNLYELFNKITEYYYCNGALIPDDEWFARHHGRIVYKPTKREVDFFETLYHLENFGIFDYTDFKTHQRIGILERLQNLRKIIKDPKPILDTGIWPPIILRRLGIGFYHKPYSKSCFQKSFSEKIRIEPQNESNKYNQFNPKNKTKIAFLLGYPEISGGTIVIFEHAIWLARRGFQVFIITLEKILPHRYAWHPEAVELNWHTFHEVRNMHFDFVIATWWVSVFRLRMISARTYLYFVQSIESRFIQTEDKASDEKIAEKRLAESTYLYPLPVITEAQWIQEYLKVLYGHSSVLVRNGIRKDIYKIDSMYISPRTSGKLRVLVEGPLGVSFKNVEKTVELCSHSDADEIWLMTSSKVETFPGVDRVYSQVPLLETPAIYRSCDVLVKLSYIEGMFGPPLEMFHCGGTAIVYNVTGYDEYIRHNFNSIVVQTNDEVAVIEKINMLKHQPAVLERLKRGACKTAQKWPSWERAAKNLEKVLNRFKTRNWPDQSYLGHLTDNLHQNFEKEMQLINLAPFYKKNLPSPQTFQLYWHAGQGFSEPKSWKTTYKSGQWVILTKPLYTDSKTICLRIDPAMKNGVVIIEYISIYSTEKNRPVVSYNASKDWTSLEIAGTAHVLSRNGSLVIESNGQDPQILLPLLEFPKKENEIKIEARIKFMSFAQAVRDLFSNKENST